VPRTASHRDKDVSPGFRKKAVWWVETALFVGGTFVLSLTPISLVTPIGRAIGAICYRILGSRRKVALENLAAACTHLPPGSDPEKIARAAFANLGTSFMEDCKLYHGRGQKLLDGIVIEGMEHYVKAREKGKGVLFITGHCGNWELMALNFGHVCLKEGKFTILARQQDNPYLNSVIEKMRSSYGNRVIYKKGALFEIVRLLRRNEIIGILIDQSVMPAEGYQIEFLGRKAWTTRMPVLVSRKTGVPILPGFIHRYGKGARFVILPEVVFPSAEMTDEALARDTAILSGYVEEYIRSYPEEWFWVHRRWKSREPMAAPSADDRNVPARDDG